VTPVALIYSLTLSDQWALALGGYTTGGAKAEYDGVNFPLQSGNNPLAATVKTNLVVTELSAGVAYKPIEKLRIGASWRVSYATADFASFALPLGNNNAVSNVEFSNLTDTEYLGYRLGAQWEEDAWGVGIAYRSEIDFAASGSASGAVGIAGQGVLPLTSPGATVYTSLPSQLIVGGHCAINPSWRAYAQYDFTNYSRVDVIGITGNYSVPTQGTSAFPGLRMNWLDQHVLRLAGEYLGLGVPLRFGYAYTSQVASSDYARATFAPPGAAHTVTLGSGLEFVENRLRADLALDYTTGSGTGNQNLNDPTARAGSYGVNAVAVNLGASYSF
jgi:long-subunit fatty acid transport protein